MPRRAAGSCPRGTDFASVATTAALFGAFAVASPLALHRSAASLLRDGPTLRDRLLTLGCPRAFLWGARTLAAPEQAGWAATLAARGVATAIVPGAGHHMNLDNPEGFALTLARLLDTAFDVRREALRDRPGAGFTAIPSSPCASRLTPHAYFAAPLAIST